MQIKEVNGKEKELPRVDVKFNDKLIQTKKSTKKVAKRASHLSHDEGQNYNDREFNKLLSFEERLNILHLFENHKMAPS